jgi:hypothetical protein
VVAAGCPGAGSAPKLGVLADAVLVVCPGCENKDENILNKLENEFGVHSLTGAGVHIVIGGSKWGGKRTM